MDDIMSGRSLPGARLPSVREYAVAVEVNANTVMRTYTWLQEQGLIYNKRGIGYFVSPDAVDRTAEILKTTFVNDEARYFFSRLKSFGVTPERLAEMYSEYLEVESGKCKAESGNV